MFLLLLSVILITPQLIFEYWKDVEDSLDLKYSWISSDSVNEYIQSLSTMVVSIILIPFFLDMMVKMEDFRAKSQR